MPIKKTKMEHVELEPTQLVLLENNPRTLSKNGFERLKKSLNSPQGKELFKKRPCLVNRRLVKNGWPQEQENLLIIYGGNQRFRAAQSLEFKAIPCIIDELTPDQEREENLKDNLTVGEWDFDLLGNNYDPDYLVNQGLDLRSIGFMGEGFERPVFDLGKAESLNPKNEKYFYIEYYDDDETFQALLTALAAHMKSAHEIDAAFFAELIKNHVKV